MRSPRAVLMVFSCLTWLDCSGGGSGEDSGWPDAQDAHDDGLQHDGEDVGDFIDGPNDEPADATDGSADAGDDEALPDPGEAGTFSYDKSTATVPAGTRPDSAAVELDIWLPQNAGAAPLVALGHGFMLDPALYTSYGEHLASWGYAAAVVHYSGSALSPRAHRLLAVDLMAVLDWFDRQCASGGQFHGAIDSSRLFLAGHSMGGKIALLTASQDGRPLGVFGLDPVDAAGGPLGGDPVDYPSVTPELMDQIQIPLLLLGETTNSTGTQPCAPEEDNFHQYFLYAVSPACEVEFIGADHMDFLDNPDCGLLCSVCPEGPADHQLVKLWSRRLLVAWLKVKLEGESAFRVYLDGEAVVAAISDGTLRQSCKNGF